MIKKIIIDKNELSKICDEITQTEIKKVHINDFIIIDELSLQSEAIIELTTQINQITRDLIDTANHYKFSCIGLAANQIGYNFRIILVKIKNKFIPMVNPIIISKSKQIRYGNESCLSFPGVKKRIKRHLSIIVTYFDPIKNKQIKRKKLKNKAAIIFQHEVDHLNGILI